VNVEPLNPGLRLFGGKGKATLKGYQYLERLLSEEGLKIQAGP
jgi:hypothetical protein